MTLRELHITLGRIFAPFFVLAGLTALPLFFRDNGFYPKSIKYLLISIHNWEIALNYSGLLLALALFLMSLTGILMTFQKVMNAWAKANRRNANNT